MTYCFFIVSNFLMTWCCLFIFYGCWLVTFSLHDLFPIFDSMIPLIIYCLFFFQLNWFIQFSVAAGAEIILTHLVTERMFFFTFSPFSFLFVLFFMSGGDISLTHRGLIGAKTAELPQTLSRVSKLSFCQIERKMLSDKNHLELRINRCPKWR